MSRIFRTLLAFLTVLLLCFATQAQEKIPGITGKGIKFGSGWGSLSTNSPEFEAGSVGAFTVGAFLTYSITPELAIQPEVIYAGKGSGNNDIISGDGYKLKYLEFPVLLKYKLLPQGRMVPSVFMGPAVSALLSANIWQENFFSDNESYDVKDGMKSMDFGLVFGGEVAFTSIQGFKVFFDVRYTLGLANIIDPLKWNAGRTIVDEGDWGIFHWIDYDRPLIDEDVDAKNRVVTIMLGARF